MNVKLRMPPWRRPFVICSTAFVLAAVLATLNLALVLLGHVAIFPRIPTTWAEGGLDAGIILLTVAVAVRFVSAIERERRQSETNYAALIEHAHDGILIIQDGHVAFANSKMYDISGFTLEEARSRVFLDFVSQADQDTVADAYSRRLAGEEVADRYTVDILAKDGTNVPVEISSSVIEFNGQPADMAIVRDITERKQAEEALKRERENFHNSMETSPIGLQIITRDGDPIYANQALLNMWGYESTEDLRSVPLKERVTEETFVRIQDLMKDDDIETSLDKFPHETDIIRKDGQVRHIHTYRNQITWNGCECIRLSYEDVTERKAAEKALQMSEEYLRTIVENAPLGIAVSDNHAQFLGANHAFCQTLGYTEAELKKMSFKDITHPDDLAGSISIVADLEAGRAKHVVQEKRYVKKDGQVIHGKVSVGAVRDGRDKPSYYVAQLEDITERKKAEESLRFSDAAFQSIHEAVFAMDNNFVVTHWNEICEQMFGIGASNAIGRYIGDVIHMVEDHPGQNQKRIELLLARGHRGEEQLYRTPRGDLWVDVHTQAIQSDGKRFGWVTLAADVTERKQAETLYRSLTDSAPVGVYIVQGRHIVYANAAFKATFGYGDHDLADKLPISLVHPEDRARVRESAIAMLRGKTDEPYELRYVTSTGETRWAVERVSSILYDGKRATLGNLLDITQMKHAEARIKRAAEEWRTTFDSITDLISIHDRDNRLVRVNMAFARALGSRPQDVLGKKCHELLHGSDAPPKGCPFAEALDTGKPATREASHGSSFTCWQESTSPVFDEHGQVVGTVNIMKDVTERKEMEQRLMMTDRLASIGELVSGIAHELNNPLTGVIGFSQLIMEKDIADDIREDLTIVANEAQRAARIVKNLLTFARKHAPVKQPSQINSIIEDVLRLRAYEQRVNNIEVITKLDPNLPEIMADYFQIQQVFLNIIINAEYFMVETHRRGTFRIATDYVDGVVRASFADDGPGISTDNLGHLFDPFFTTKEVGKGTGLGLSICHGIVTEHGGHIYARNEPGNGATFVVELPVDEGEQGSPLVKGPGYVEQAANSAYSR